MTEKLTQEVIERLRLLRDEHFNEKEPGQPDYCGECADDGVTIEPWPCLAYRELAIILAVLEAAHEYAIAEQAGLDSVKAKRRALLALYEPMEATNK